jgi:hypothetical protein
MNMTPERPLIFINPAIRWAVHPAHQHQLRHVDGVAGPQKEPAAGDVVTLEFIVDAVSGLPCPVRITEVLYAQQPGQTVIIPVVAKYQPD